MATAEQLGIQKPAKKTKVRKKKPAPKPSYSSVSAIEGAKGARKSAKLAAKPIRKKSKQTTLGLPTPAKVARAQKRALREASAGPIRKAERRAAQAARHEAMHPSLLEGGLVGQIDPEFAGEARKVVFGKKNPSAGEVLLAAAPIPAFKGAQAARAVLRGSKGLKTAEKAAKGAKTLKVAKAGRKAKKTAQKAKATSRVEKARATGRGMSAASIARLSKVERKARRAQRADRALRAATSPVGAAAAASPGDVGERVRAFAEGTVKADPRKSIPATLSAVPATFAFLGSAAAGGYRSVKTGSTKPLEGVAKAGGRAFEALEPLASGDPEKVKEATEDIGYVFAPLLPRGAVSTPARAVGRGIKKGAKATAAKVPTRTPPGRPRTPGKGRRLAQTVAGGKTRKRVALIAARETGPARREATRAAAEVDKVARKGKLSRRMRDRGAADADSVAVVLARYGIGRKGDPMARLADVERTLDPSDAGFVNTRRAIEFAKANPRVLGDDATWKTASELRKQTKKLETSPTAKYRAQAQVAGVELTPEMRAPRKVRKITGEVSREGAWNAVKAKVVEAKNAKRAGRQDDFQRLMREAEEAHKALDPYSRPGTRPNLATKRKDWDPEMVEDFLADVKAQRHSDLEEPAWLSEPAQGLEPTEMGGPKVPSVGPRAQRVSTGAAAKADLAARDLPSVLRDSVMRPHIQRGVNRFIRRFTDEFSEKVDGKTVFTGRELVALHNAGKIDLRELAPVPSRHWKQSVDAEDFEPAKFHEQITKDLQRDFRALEHEKGTKYILTKREAAEEFADQLSPTGKGLEGFANLTGTVGSRVVLFSPAWVAAQFVNEGSQAVTAVGAHGILGAAADMSRMARRDPEGYRNLIHFSGDSAPASQPIPPRLSMDASDHTAFVHASRAARKTPVGRFLWDLGSLRTFGNIDRWKSTHIRNLVAVARSNKELGAFTKGLAGMVRSQDALSQKMAKMSRQERLSYQARNPKEFQRYLDYTDDVMGNWEAFTRFERQFGPLAAFYPYLRMSLRWTFWSYPKRHPVKAQILYLLSQQNRDELSKLLGREPDFLESAMPVIYDEEGEPDAVFPAGRRFGAPGMNTLVEAIGEGNLARLPNILNPVLGAAYRAASGTDPFTGKQNFDVSDPVAYGLNALNQFLSLSPAVRAAGLNKQGKQKSGVAEVFENIDPNRAFRSAVNPFLPLSGERLRMQTILGDALEAVEEDPEYGDLVQAILSGDKGKVSTLAKKVDLADEARNILDQFLPSSKIEEAAVGQAGEIIREGTKATKPKKSGGGGTAYGEVFEGGGGGGGGGGTAFTEVFGK